MIATITFVFIFYVIFIGCFGDTSISQTLALGELPLHNASPGTIGRLEWITIIIWTAVLIIQAGLLGKCSCDCIRQIFHTDNNTVPAIIISASMIIIIIASYLHLTDILIICTSTTVSIISAIIHLGILFILVIGYIIIQRRKPIITKTPGTKAIRRAKKC